MLLDWILPVLLCAAILLAVIGAFKRINLWRQGQPDKINILHGLMQIPKRYMVDLHHVVARDKYIANTHVATAGGFVAASVLIILVYVFGFNNRILVWGLLAALTAMLIGAFFVYKRRKNPPARLSKGPWMRLPKSLFTFAITFILISLPAAGILPENFGGWLLATILLAGVVYGVAEMFFGMTWGGPMKHAFAGALHLAFHRRAERFGGGRSTALKPIQLEENKLGVEQPADFKWNQLLGFDACVQCGRCEAMCPAFAAGQPLNPKKLIQDMVVGLAGGTDAKYAGSPYPGIEVGQHQGAPLQPIVNGLVEADTLWSCTTCRACVEECPMMIEHVDAIVDMRRFLTLEQGQTPEKGVEVIENLIATDNPNGFDPSHRVNWATDLNLPLMTDVQEADVLFWIGDGAYDMRTQRTLRAVVKLLRAAKVDFAILGNEERDSGDVARRLGDEATFQSLAKHNIATLKKYQFKQIVTADPHSYHCLKNEYKDFGAAFEVYHHTTFLAEQAKQGTLKLGELNLGTVTYHDPCYLGRYNGEYEAPRELLKALGLEVTEMERSGFRSRCCGGGGAAPITDIPGKQRIPDMRMEDVKATNAEVVAVACPQCALMLEGVVEPRPEVRDIAEMLAEAVETIH
ncbi:(Fe-S)-binding protein [Endozoicomonas sp. SM1973]|uniref:(Fe-S)-binding protein n=1 Tax=Spartinivicinus marinus TaxID=2994442 RepID=A0A853I3R6_9GAMM|nr:(Fe-S)-binding protein [Spartinivicinus marinus]MCX4026767.1 (Fe-S)-binding protein [Spartinivicinus marinus]NYZ64601.1 (Fe-S)-binding protein [Spartinivicinus marinus]